MEHPKSCYSDAVKRNLIFYNQISSRKIIWARFVCLHTIILQIGSLSERRREDYLFSERSEIKGFEMFPHLSAYLIFFICLSKFPKFFPIQGMDIINGEYPPGVFFKGSQVFRQKNKRSLIFRRKFMGSNQFQSLTFFSTFSNFQIFQNFQNFQILEDTDPNIAKIVTISEIKK